MNEPVNIRIGGPPVAKQAPRFIRGRDGITESFQPKKVRDYEDWVRAAAQRVMDARPPLEGPVTLRICFNMPTPASWSKKKRLEAYRHLVLPTTRPDIDNLCKAVLDGLKMVVYRDDNQITDLIVSKRYSIRPSAVVVCRAIEGVDLVQQASAA